ncbi:hypothetical protein GCM10010472_34410 [Pseudonocardia halophobica]|uniref:NAD glycohydrolase translocation F5/8 type C domain-containing protein n=1 Tax=Pseudonocardia halophobica TaxID=29401 RepID=A0A9W6L4R3_9PSEU|nr:hypothetical protein GCM10017577_32210 [Pseudonocardia halophobica]
MRFDAPGVPTRGNRGLPGAPVAVVGPQWSVWPVVITVIAGLLVLGVLLTLLLWSPRVTPATPVVPVATTPVTTAMTASATCVRPDSTDAAGVPTSYEPSQAVDGVLATAWRCTGDGVGESLTLTFAAPIRVGSVGIVPGLAKIDPADGTDRYAQNRRLTAVRLTTDDGRWVTIALDPSVGRRGLQWTALSATVTSRLTITVLDSAAGTAQNGQAANDTIAVSEIVVA